ncbi:nitrogen fixation protein NifQ [Paraburkholderia sp. CNPSo 3274]|uniref:nitrogen fixation protein NifQ n=1 Tax=Paraburkholderia sp. CNPSo 3274 TaxID=2940932 RepID=UPI0020B76768|nr:nitrogen fixation protein NifQ [Paraburkholderia sp. CNPSo 3274]MCP3712066.1 nitrogen fixation protein NifQ [Paraburkholderia sp. CNPSo 3274]
MDYYAALMRYARNPDDLTVLAVAGVLAAAVDEGGTERLPIPGLDAEETHWLLARWFPDAESSLGLYFGAPAADSQPGPSYDDIDLVTLLKTYANPVAGTTTEIHCISHALACACAGKKHLWQELRLSSRGELSALIEYWFPSLAEKNVHGMKWKKFIYKELCRSEALNVCRASSCGECAEYSSCFGPE